MESKEDQTQNPNQVPIQDEKKSEENEKKPEENEKKEEQEEKVYELNIDIVPIFENGPAPFKIENLKSTQTIKSIRKRISQKFTQYKKSGFKLYFKEEITDKKQKIKDAKLLDGDYILWDYQQPEKKSKIPDQVICLVDGYDQDIFLFEDQINYSKEKTFGAILSNIDHIKPIKFVELSEVKLVGEKEVVIKKEDLDTYKEQTLEQIAENLTHGLKEQILKIQDPDNRGIKPQPGQEMKDKALKIIFYYQQELQEVVRIQFQSAFNSKIPEIFYDFNIESNLESIYKRFGELFAQAIDAKDNQLPSKFKIYSLNKLNEKEYFEDMSLNLKDIAKKLKIYKKKKYQYSYWYNEQKEIDHIPNKIQTFVLIVDFDPSVYLIHAPELAGTNKQQQFFIIDQNEKVSDLLVRFNEFFQFNTQKLQLVQYFEAQDPQNEVKQKNQEKPWWWYGKFTLSGEADEEQLQKNNKVVILNDKCTLEQYAMLEQNCKVFHIKKNYDVIIKQYPFEVQQLLYKMSKRWNPESLKKINQIPWNEVTTLKGEHNILKSASWILNRDNVGLEAQKREILTFLAYQQQIEKQNPQSQAQVGQILLFIGPAGTGKTSFAMSIAEALQRKFAKICLAKNQNLFGNQNSDWWENKHGLIIDALIDSGSMNPVILLDEIDKVPLAKQNQLISLLDPMQNNKFVDEVLQIPVDLSQVYFICTANSACALSQPLKNRLKIITFEGYGTEEKIEIARHKLIPNLQKQLNSKELDFNNDVLRFMLQKYVYGAGVRDFEKKLTEIVNYKCFKLHSTSSKEERALLRQNGFKFDIELLQEAWPLIKTKLRELEGYIRKSGCSFSVSSCCLTRFEIAKIQNTQQEKQQINVTGNIDNIMFESIQLCVNLVKSLYLNKHFDQILNSHGVQVSSFNDLIEGKSSLHIHSYPNAREKSGSQEGLAIAIALISLLLDQKVNYRYAFIGELTLQGYVEQSFAVLQKIMIAKKQGIQRVYVPKINEAELKHHFSDVVEIVYVDNIQEILDPQSKYYPFVVEENVDHNQFNERSYLRLVKTYSKVEN